VDSIKVTRVVDAAKRRGPLRAKVGAGLTREEFLKGVAAKKLGHVGLSESAAIIALGLGIPIEEITETIEPVLAKEETDGVAVGRVLGLHQIALIQAGDEVLVELDLTMAVGVSDPADTIVIEGDPPVRLRVAGGFHGDRATVGCVVNAIPFIVAAPPGLHTVVTLPLFGLFPRSRVALPLSPRGLPPLPAGEGWGEGRLPLSPRERDGVRGEPKSTQLTTRRGGTL
jgi:4-hydroxy-tetrahydrodipicolinate reductase